MNSKLLLLSKKTSDNAFKFTIDTNLGTGASFLFPLRSGYNYDFVADMGDGNQVVYSGDGSTPLSHTYAAHGEYQISITGTYEADHYNNGGDKLKIKGIDQWGLTGRIIFDRSFYGCSNMTYIAEDFEAYDDLVIQGESMFRDTGLTSIITSMRLSNLVNGSNMFQGSPLVSLSTNMTLDSLVTGSSMFYQTNLTALPNTVTFASLETAAIMFFNVPLASLPNLVTLSNLKSGSSMLRGTNLTSLPPNMTLSSLTDGSFMFLDVTINPFDYSDLLIRTEAANQNNNVSFHGGNSKYNTAGGVARQSLIDDHTWSFTDGGPA